MAFLTRSTAIEWIGTLDPSSTAENTLIDRLMVAVEAAIAGYLGFPPASVGAAPTIEDTTYTHYTGAGLAVIEDGAALLLSLCPVVSITGLYEDTLWSYATAKDSADYVLEGDTGIVRLTPSGSWGSANTSRRAIKSVYVAGYTSVPAPIVQAGYTLVAIEFNRRRTQGQTSFSEGGVSIGIDTSAMPKNVEKMLEPYVLFGRAIP